jgi:hypothetical protein
MKQEIIETSGQIFFRLEAHNLPSFSGKINPTIHRHQRIRNSANHGIQARENLRESVIFKEPSQN